MVDPLILALDTSTSHAGAALVRSGETIAQTEWDWGRGRSGLLEAEVRALLRAAVSAPDGLAVASGPGGFSTLRAGMAFAKGYCLARGIPLVAVPTAEALARSGGSHSGLTVTVIPAGRGRYYRRIFAWEGNEPKALDESELTTIDDLAADAARLDTIVVGALEREDLEAIRKRSEALPLWAPPSGYLNLAPQVGLIGSERLAATGKDSALEAVPAYASPAGATRTTRGWGRV